MKTISDLFQDKRIVKKIQNKLPYLFQIAELESQRAGKIGMEVGSLRERILVSLLIYYFGRKNVQTEVPITEPEIDVYLFKKPISIKTKTGKQLSGIKLIWTVDPESAKKFQINYLPVCDMLFTQIYWNAAGGLYLFPHKTQLNALKYLGREKYIKLPKEGTNPRGVEISSDAMSYLINHSETMKIDIDWGKEEIKFNPFKRWEELWKQN